MHTQGFHKILKKRDKVLPHAPCQQFYLSHLHQQSWVQVTTEPGRHCPPHVEHSHMMAAHIRAIVEECSMPALAPAQLPPSAAVHPSNIRGIPLGMSFQGSHA